MKDRGVVQEIKGHRAKVSLEYDPERCGSCEAKLFCGISSRKNQGFVWARFDREPEPGQEVVVEIPEAKAILLSTILFIVPIGVYFLSYWLISIWVHSVGMAALMSLLPVALYYPALMLFSDFFTPRIISGD